MGENTIIISLILFNLLFTGFIGGIIVFVTKYRKKKKQHQQELGKVNLLHKKELLETQIEIQTQTMEHIDREIHDNVGQKITLASIYSKQLSYENPSKNITKQINQINEILNESLVELRQLSRTLTDDGIKENTIQQLIRMEVQKVKNLGECNIKSEIDEEIIIKSHYTKTILLRITQEFIQNSLKHAHCDTIFVYLVNLEKAIELKLTDDGVGFNSHNSESKGIGLKNIKKRVEIINGAYELNSELNIGTVLTVKIPKE